MIRQISRTSQPCFQGLLRNTLQETRLTGELLRINRKSSATSLLQFWPILAIFSADSPNNRLKGRFDICGKSPKINRDNNYLTNGRNRSILGLEYALEFLL